MIRPGRNGGASSYPALNSRAVAVLARGLDVDRGFGFPGALCAQVGPEFYFVAEGAKVSNNDRKARALCFHCPVRVRCLEYAISHPDASHYGVWGGLMERNLRWLRQEPLHGPERPPAESKTRKG
jgi:WhiB family redox-sensing transcriptional regulator